MPHEQFGLRELRKELGLSGELMASRLGLSGRSAVSNIERDGRCSASVAIAIERLSIKDGVPRINAATLNGDIALARATPAIPEEAA